MAKFKVGDYVYIPNLVSDPPTMRIYAVWEDKGGAKYGVLWLSTNDELHRSALEETFLEQVEWVDEAEERL